VVSLEGIRIGGIVQCRCVSRHSPPVRIADEHHVWPKALGGPDIAANKVVLCSNAHRLVHEYLDRIQKANGEVKHLDTVGFPKSVRQIAELGWERIQKGSL
jgi:predicted restriction endonuclease